MQPVGNNNAQSHAMRLIHLVGQDTLDNLKAEFNKIPEELRGDVLEELRKSSTEKAQTLLTALSIGIASPALPPQTKASVAPPAMPKDVGGGGGGGANVSSTTQENLSLSEFKNSFFKDVNTLNKEAAKLHKTLEEIPEDQRRDFAKHALPLCEGINDFHKAYVINALAEVPAEERESVIKYTHELSQGLENFQKHYVIKALAKVPEEERESFTKYAQSLSQGLYYGSKAKVIVALAKVPAEERESVTKYTHELSQGLNGDSKANVIAALANVPEGEKELFSRLCQSLYFVSGKDSNTRAIIIQTLAKLPSGQREKAALIARRRINEEMHRWDVGQTIKRALDNPLGADEAAMAKQGVNVHAKNRDKQTRDAIQILEMYQKELSADEIDKGVEAFKAYLEASRDDTKKVLARRALVGPKEWVGFGPLLESVEFTVLGYTVVGKTFIARLWKLTETLQDPNEQSNARETMINALADSYESGGLVCNQGKVQRLCATLAHFEELGLMLNSTTSELQVTPEKALKAFNAFYQETRGGGGAGGGSKEQSKEVLSLVESFCGQNPLVNKLSLISALGLSKSEDAPKMDHEKAVKLFTNVPRHAEICAEAVETNNIFPLLEAIVAFCADNPDIDKELLIDDMLSSFG